MSSKRLRSIGSRLAACSGQGPAKRRGLFPSGTETARTRILVTKPAEESSTVLTSGVLKFERYVRRDSIHSSRLVQLISCAHQEILTWGTPSHDLYPIS